MIIKIRLNKHFNSAKRFSRARNFHAQQVNCVLYAENIQQSLLQCRGIAQHRKATVFPETIGETQPLLTVKELCRFLKISERKSRRLRKMGRLPFIKQDHRVLFEPLSVMQAFK